MTGVIDDLETLAPPVATQSPESPGLVIDLTEDLTIDLTDDTTPELGVPASIRSWARTAGVGQRSIMRGLRATGEAVAVMVVALSVGLWIGGLVGWFVGLPGLLVALARIQNLTHESAHRSVWPAGWANDVTLAAIGVITLQPAHVYRAFHFAHHRHTRVEGKDPEAFYDRVGTRSRYVATLIGGGLVFTASMWIGWIQTLIGRPPTYANKRNTQRDIRVWGTVAVALLAALISTLVSAGYGRFVLLWWVLPVVIFQAGPYTFATLFEHLNADSTANIIDTSGTIRSNRAVSWLLLNGNYHAAHHTIPSASWWRLPELDAAIQHWRTENCQPAPAGIEHRSVIDVHRRLWRALKHS